VTPVAERSRFRYIVAMAVFLKVCCITSPAEAALAIEHGAAALGLVSEMPSGPGVVSEEVIATIVASVPPSIATFLLTSKRSTREIVAQQRRTGASSLQLVDDVGTTVLEELRAELPGVHLIQVLHVRDAGALESLEQVEAQVDAILLDSGDPAAPVPTLGGTGKVHDWTISRAIVERSHKPVFLAGGLAPENVAGAVRQVGPAGLDVCSGLRSAGALDRNKLQRFTGELVLRSGPLFAPVTPGA
jgi:phosphoribosylanthranilate isomerase